MTKMTCTKCGVEHDVDATKLNWSVLCPGCRPVVTTSAREWLRLKGKAAARKRQKAVRK